MFKQNSPHHSASAEERRMLSAHATQPTCTFQFFKTQHFSHHWEQRCWEKNKQ